MIFQGGFEINLDNRKLKTPQAKLFTVPSEALAIAVATEWDSQRDTIKFYTMHLVTSSAPQPGPLLASSGSRPKQGSSPSYEEALWVGVVPATLASLNVPNVPLWPGRLWFPCSEHCWVAGPLWSQGRCHLPRLPSCLFPIMAAAPLFHQHLHNQ